MLTDREFLIQTRACLIKQAQALQEQRAAILQNIAVIERRLGMEKQVTQPVASGPKPGVTYPPNGISASG